MIAVDQVDRARAFDLAVIAASRGHTLRRQGGEMVGPCPRCGDGVDRFAINTVKQKFNCRVCQQGGRGAIDLVMFIDDVEFAEAVERLIGGAVTSERRSQHHRRASPSAAVGDEYDRRQHSKAAWLWSQRRPISGSVAETYLCEARGLTNPLPPTLAFLPAWRDYPPTMIAAYSLPVEIEPGILAAPTLDPADAAVHLTRLLADGSDREGGDDAKITIGRPLGRPIVVAPFTDMPSLLIPEGIEDALTVHHATGLGAWAAGSASFMPALATAVPSFIRRVTICADDDPSGRRGAQALAKAIHARGTTRVFIEGLP